MTKLQWKEGSLWRGRNDAMYTIYIHVQKRLKYDVFNVIYITKDSIQHTSMSYRELRNFYLQPLDQQTWSLAVMRGHT